MFHFWTPPSISSLVEKPFGNFDFASSALAFWRLLARTGVWAEQILEAGRGEGATRRRRTEAGRVDERRPIDGVGNGPADVPVGELGQLFVHYEQVDLPGREELDREARAAAQGRHIGRRYRVYYVDLAPLGLQDSLVVVVYVKELDRVQVGCPVRQ